MPADTVRYERILGLLAGVTDELELRSIARDAVARAAMTLGRAYRVSAAPGVPPEDEAAPLGGIVAP